MNLVKRAAQVVGAGLSLSDFDRFLDMMVGGQPSYTGKLVSPQTALAVGAVWACVNRISEDIARMPLLTYTENGDDREIAKNHYLYPILMEETNPEMTAFRFKLFMQAWVLLAGNAYAEIQTNGRGQIMALWPWRADRTSISRRDGDSGPLVYTYTMQSGKKYHVPGAKMFHLRGLTLNGIQGLSPIEVHKQTVGLSLAVTEHGARFFSNGARPLGIISHPQALSDKAKQNIQNSWMEMHQGLANAHRVAILEEAMVYKDVGYNMVDAQYIEAAGLTDQTVARIYQVPQHKIGILDKATFSNIQQQGLDYIQSCMGSWSNNWEQEIGFSLLSPRERQTIAVGFDFTDLIMGDFQSLGTFIAMLTDRGVANADEVRRKYLKWNAQPDGIGKTFYKAVNMAPVSPEKIEADSDPNFLPPTPAPQVAPIPPPDKKKKENYVNGHA